MIFEARDTEVKVTSRRRFEASRRCPWPSKNTSCLVFVIICCLCLVTDGEEQLHPSPELENVHWTRSQPDVTTEMAKISDPKGEMGNYVNGTSAKGEPVIKGEVMEPGNETKEQHQPTEDDDWPPWPTLKPAEIKTDLDRIYFRKYNILPKRSTACDNVSLPSFDYTLVTALINLRRENWPRFRRQFIKYLYYAAKMLDFHAPMVIYVEPEAVDFVLYHRQGKEHLTKVIPTSLGDLPYYRQYHDRIREIMESDEFKDGHTLLHHPEGFSPDYNVLMNSKLPMLFEASATNPFSTRYFYWMDVGYGHGEDVYPESCYWAPWSIMNGVNQISYIQLNPLSLLRSVDDLYKKFLPPFLNGAFFGGPSISIRRYYFLHRQVFRQFLDQGKVDDDQTMAVACYFKNPMLFNVVEGWWYDAFTLFR